MKKTVIAILSVLAGAILGAGTVRKVTGESLTKVTRMSNKHMELFLLMNQWVKVKQEGKNLCSYFKDKGYKKIAIYGMSYIGETLNNELRDTDITVAYGIDQRADSICTDVDVVTMEDRLEKVDAVVVTAVAFFDEIEARLSEKMDCPIISLEDMLYEI